MWALARVSGASAFERAHSFAGSMSGVHKARKDSGNRAGSFAAGWTTSWDAVGIRDEGQALEDPLALVTEEDPVTGGVCA